MKKIEFKLEKVAEKFSKATIDLFDILKTNNKENVIAIINEQLDELQKQKLLKIAFIGQYNAGKSTIVKALTGNSSIVISSNVETSRPTDYEWNNILLTDTPGLWAGKNEEHDEISKRAIINSDLLIYVITNELFDSIVLKNFIDLAYKQHYKDKMLVVLNKMSRENGEFTVLKNNYLESIKKSFKPVYEFDFDIQFIDAADYLEGIKENEPDLIELSHFNEFIERLNQFVQKKGLISKKLDTPVRFLLSQIDRLVFEQEDPKFSALLNRVEQRIFKHLNNSKAEVELLSNKLRRELINKGSEFAGKIGEETIDIMKEQAEIESFVRIQSDKASKEIEEKLEGSRRILSQDIKDVFESDVAQYFFEEIKLKELNLNDVQLSDNNSLRTKFNFLNDLSEKLTGKVLNNTLNSSATTTTLKAANVAGSNMHSIVYSVGKFFGYSFKPYGAIHLAQKIGIIAKVAGPVFAIAGVGLTVKEIYDDSENQKKIARGKEQSYSEFINIANEIENHVMNQFENYKSKTINPILEDIQNKRQGFIEKGRKSKEFEAQVFKVKDQLSKLLIEIHE